MIAFMMFTFVSLKPRVCSLTTVKMEEDFVPVGDSEESSSPDSIKAVRLLIAS
jgi:hypothetical protein